MQKLYNIVKVMLIFALLFTQNNLQAQKCCVECQADVKVVSDKQVLLEKIDLKEGTLTTNINTNLYVSYRSGNTQKFWTNLVIATAGVAVSTQLNNSNLAEGKSANSVSPLLPLGVSVATLPSIWKNRPRGIPQAGLWIQHRDTRGKLLETWEQPISSEAKNDAELLTVSIDKPLTAGTLEVYLQNGSKNGVYYWGYGTTSKSAKPIFQNPVVSSSMAGCPDGYLPNGNGMCCNPFTGDCVSEGGGDIGSIPPNEQSYIETKSETRVRTTTGNGGCPSGYLPNGQGKCCNPFSEGCVDELPVTQGTAQICIIERCIDVYQRVCFMGNCSSWTYIYSNCSNTTFQCGQEGGGGTGGTGTGGTGTGGGGNNDSGNEPKGFSTLVTRFNRPDRRSEVINSKCAGYRRMWEYSFRNNDPVLTKEMGGLLTSTGKVIILPSYDNGATSVSFKSSYFDETGRSILEIYLQQGLIKVDVISYEGNSQIGTTITHNVEATIHSHPYTNGTLYDIYNASSADLKVAENYPEIKHYLLTQDKIVEYNSTNTQISANLHNCP